jgi:hypothetical protein
LGHGDPVAKPEAAMTAVLFKTARVVDLLLAAIVVVAFS